MVKPVMDDKAANDGDKLKHSLLLEVISRCNEWNELNYAETHAGAGLYNTEVLQTTSHIDLLQQRTSYSNPYSEEAGYAYYKLLTDWWDTREDFWYPSYPGSVLQTAMSIKKDFDLRATEADSETFNRLEASLKSLKSVPNFAIRNQGFQHNTRWLVEKDNLVLLVDPFYFFFNREGEDVERHLNSGGIDITTLRCLLVPCSLKNAVVLFWCYFKPHTGQFEIVQDLIARSSETMATVRTFRSGESYYLFAIGSGNGRSVVESLPGREQWANSWLADVVTEV